MQDKGGAWHWFFAKESIFKRKADGTPVQIFGITTDITDSKKAEEVIKKNEQQLQSIYDASSNAIFLLDILKEDQYKFVSVNKGFLLATGLSKEQVLNKYVHDVIPQPSLQLVLEKYRETIYTKKTVHWEEITPYPTGTKVGIVYISPVFNEDGKCIQLLGTVHDITERKNAEEEIKKTSEQLRELTSHLQNIREEERTSIAREIHDELGQQLTGLKMDVSWIKKQLPEDKEVLQNKISGMIALIDETVKTVRRISSDLRPGILDDLGLIPAIEWQSQEFEKRTGIKSEFQTNLTDLDPEKNLSINIFRVYQEALTNIIRHSNATRIKTTFEEKDGNLKLVIQDNGIGFDIDELKNNNSLGLIGMKERAFLFQGELVITSEKSKGTMITLKIPFHKNK
jgi:PAS domain S-box-containing protein